MTHEPPPPMPASLPPPPAPAPSRVGKGDGASGARALAWWSIGLTAAALLCCGGGAMFTASFLREKEAEVRAELETAEDDAQRVEDAEALLDTLADELAAGSAALPITLPEAPPRDPWGNPLRYRRSGPHVAFLRSAGPDGVFGTQDDVSREVRIR